MSAAPCPPGVTVGAHPNRFNFVHRSSQIYFSLFLFFFGIVGTVACISQATKTENNLLYAAAAGCLIIFGGCGVWLCFKHKWAKASIEFDNKQVLYVTAAFPMALWASPNKNMPIANLGNLVIHDTGETSGTWGGPSRGNGRGGRGSKSRFGSSSRSGHSSGNGGVEIIPRSGGEPIYDIRVSSGNNNSSGDDILTLAQVSGQANVATVVNAWTVWLQSHGIAVTSNADTIGDFGGQSNQLAAFGASPQGPPMMMSPVGDYGQPTAAPANYHSGHPPQHQHAVQQQQQYHGGGQQYQQQQHPSMNMAPSQNMNVAAPMSYQQL